MKNTRQYLEYFKQSVPVGLSVFAIGLLLLMFASPLALAGLCDKKPDHPKCTGGGEIEQYDFKVIFAGDNPLLLENNDGLPWELSSVTGGHGNIGPSPVGPIPFYEETIVAIGDYAQPCDLSAPFTCSARLSGSNLTKDQLTFRSNADGEDAILGNVHFYTGFDWLDSNGAVTHYTSKSHGWTDLDAFPWNPADSSFCVPIEVTHVWILQTDPVIKRRVKQCRESQYFAVCEAGVDEGQFPWINGEFRATIWRADHPDYDEENTPLLPPCSFRP